MKCDCLKKVNSSPEMLATNTEVQSIFELNFKTGKVEQYTQLATIKVNVKQRQKCKIVACAYCPFCGKKAT